MATTLTLDELRAENAAAEDETSDDEPQADESTTEPQQAAEDKTTEDDLGAEPEDSESEESEVEDWQKPDGHTSEKLFTNGDIGVVKRKLRAKLDKQHSTEIDDLRAEIAQLKISKPQTQKTELAKPNRDQYFDSDDPDGDYIDALTDYRLQIYIAEQQAENAQSTISVKQNEQQRTIDKRVDEHYLRAAELSEQSGITAELYQSSDLKVRQMIDSLYPKGGDSITDALISRLGKGSEKVMYNLGVNKARLNELQEHLSEDPSGVSAAMYLGSLRETLNNPVKRKTNAPKPAASPSGDKQSNSKHRALQKSYDAAHKAGNMQDAFDAKREAKKGGCDTSIW